MKIEASSVGEFFEKSFRFHFNQSGENEIFHRGVNEIFPKENRHIPSIYYIPGLIEHEDKIFRETVARFPDDMLSKKTTIEQLILMQHHRFPTRLLDVTKNLLVSLFFACFDDSRKDSQVKDGIVHFYSVPKEEVRYCDSDRIKIVSNLAKQPFRLRGGYDLSLSVQEFNKQDAIKQLCWDIQSESITLYERVVPKDIRSVFCLHPNMNNERINRQSGYFFLFGIEGGKNKNKCAKFPEEWILESIIIPSEAKGKILEGLGKMGIDEGFFYPDYEHVSFAIRNRYQKK
jgi:hypothetical protein